MRRPARPAAETPSLAAALVSEGSSPEPVAVASSPLVLVALESSELESSVLSASSPELVVVAVFEPVELLLGALVTVTVPGK
jgi:hypothetical protein